MHPIPSTSFKNGYPFPLADYADTPYSFLTNVCLGGYQTSVVAVCHISSQPSTRETKSTHGKSRRFERFVTRLSAIDISKSIGPLFSTPNHAEYAARTACRDHSKVCTRELRGSLRGVFYSDCEQKRNNGCKFSHSIFNTEKVLKLGGESRNFVISLDYGYGFERYGAYETWSFGWDVKVNGEYLGSRSSNQKTYNLPKSLFLAENKLAMIATDAKSEKVQSLCRAHYNHTSCRRANCRYDHDLIDAKRIQHLGRWSNEGMVPSYQILSVECRVTDGRAMWKITLKPDAFAKLSPTSPIALAIPFWPFSREGEDLLAVVKLLEAVVGVAET
ncbi:hypothetical protein GALMADRAFT_141468 [Galerina marginata CBS 339.88]|uniref:C3H1-type domain-containing protein n=1 Tax=Galerina marginata (strain CBS 339.88) TaxID=685588 RepID=A0A067SU53_GALM3|nr:hypothetical protein GALMADRAFT_141468 [Galerina marginata CBS 339.88]